MRNSNKASESKKQELGKVRQTGRESVYLVVFAWLAETYAKRAMARRR